MTPSHLALKIGVALRRRRFRAPDERTLQEGIAKAFTEDVMAFEREVVLSRKDRIDFMVGRIGVEVKMTSSSNDLLRQLARYAEFDAVTELVLVTTRARLASACPPSLNGKAILAVHLPTGLF